jgi:hypothetical protein
MKKTGLIILSLAAAVTVSSCTVYKVKEMDPQALAAKGQHAAVLAVKTKDGLIEFPENDPAKLKGPGIVGNVYLDYEFDPFEIADIVPSGKRAKVVLRGGDRLDILSSVRSGETFRCEAVKPTWIPLEEVVLAKVRVADTGSSVLATLAGAVLFVGVVALDLVSTDEIVEDSFDEGLWSLVDALAEPSPKRSVKPLLGSGNAPPVAEGSEFWVMEWMPIEAGPDEDGKLRVRLRNGAEVPRGIDEAKIVVVDHPPGIRVAPDCRGVVRSFSEPIPPLTASDLHGRDVAPLLLARDDEFWRNPGPDPARKDPGNPRDRLDLDFPRPAGARRAKLVVNVANSTWPALFAREVAALPGAAPKGKKAAPLYQEGEFAKLRVRLLTVSGWRTGQVIFAAGPLPAETTIYELDLDDVDGERVRLQIDAPAGYWLIDRVGLDFLEDKPVREEAIGAESADGPDAAGLLVALAAEDGTTAFFEDPGQESVLTFGIPAPREGMERTLFLRTVSCYDMPPRAQPDKSGLPNGPVASKWHNPPNRL